MTECGTSPGPQNPERDGPERPAPAAAARLRARIDRGGAADKVAAADPAAAPLGTDAEAAGHPPSAAEAARVETAEARRAPAARNPGPAGRRGRRKPRWCR